MVGSTGPKIWGGHPPLNLSHSLDRVLCLILPKRSIVGLVAEIVFIVPILFPLPNLKFLLPEICANLPCLNCIKCGSRFPLLLQVSLCGFLMPLVRKERALGHFCKSDLKLSNKKLKSSQYQKFS